MSLLKYLINHLSFIYSEEKNAMFWKLAWLSFQILVIFWTVAGNGDPDLFNSFLLFLSQFFLSAIFFLYFSLISDVAFSWVIRYCLQTTVVHIWVPIQKTTFIIRYQNELNKYTKDDHRGKMFYCIVISYQ